MRTGDAAGPARKDASDTAAADDSGSPDSSDNPGRRIKYWEYLDRRIGVGFSVVGVLGASVYLSLRTAYSVFYSAFDIAPEDVGLGQTEILVQSALIVVPILALIAGAVVLPVLWLAHSFERAPGEHSAKAFRRLVLNTFARRDIVIVPAEFEGDDLRSVSNLINGLHAVFGPSQNFLEATAVRLAVRLSSIAMTYEGALLLALVLYVMSLGVGVSFLTVMASNDAQAVAEGRAAQPSIGGFKVLSWGANRVDVIIRSDTGVSVSPTECYMYLGQANGSTLVYGVHRAEVLRVPSNAIVVSERLKRASC